MICKMEQASGLSREEFKIFYLNIENKRRLLKILGLGQIKTSCMEIFKEHIINYLKITIIYF